MHRSLLALSRHLRLHRTLPLSGVERTRWFCLSPLLRSLLGVKRTWVGALHMAAYDPKRTWDEVFPSPCLNSYDALSCRGSNEAARVHYARGQCGGCVAACCACAAVQVADRWIPRPAFDGYTVRMDCRICAADARARLDRKAHDPNRVPLGRGT